MSVNPHELFIIVRPSKFKSANVMAALTLRSVALSRGVELVLTDLPQGFEVLLKRYERAEEALKMAVKLGLLYWSEGVTKAYEPIVSCLSRLMRENVKVMCYLDPSDLERERELAFKVSRLVLRASIKKIDDRDIKEWVQVLDEYALGNRRISNSLIDKLKCVKERNVAVLAGLEGFHYAKRLKDEGLSVKVEAVGLPYLRSPLEVMILKHSRGELTADELKALINEYVEYIRNYVIRYESLEEAHEKWSYNKAPWLKSLLLQD
ncbi:MAG: hypothetical protein QE164_07775 [Candidatus Nezhaarchaeota archaeon]|nr:hypothetical protein [Candidatus Nezhaarchaeota archaeon]